MFTLCTRDNWDRWEYYQHYLHEVRCAYSMTVNVDITALRGVKLYPAWLYLLTDTVNAFPEFRTALSPDGVGIFDTMHPSYTIFHPEAETFSVIWTEFSPDYAVFEKRYREDTQRYASASGFAPKPGKPDNTFDVSMLPWAPFTSFHLELYTEGTHLLPIFTLGKAFEQDGRRWIPLAMQVHNAVCDACGLRRLSRGAFPGPPPGKNQRVSPGKLLRLNRRKAGGNLTKSKTSTPLDGETQSPKGALVFRMGRARGGSPRFRLPGTGRAR